MVADLLETNAAVSGEKKEPVAALGRLPEIPDFLGKAARVDSVASLIQQGQEQLQNFRGMMILNGHKPSDPMPVTDAKSGDSIPTYGERFKSIDAGIRSLMEENADIYEELVAEAVARRKQVERKIERERQS